MNKKVFVLISGLFLSCATASAQDPVEDNNQPKADNHIVASGTASPRSGLIRAFESHAGKGELKESVENGVKAASLYVKDGAYKEAFDMLRRVDQVITAHQQSDEKTKEAMRYDVSKERMQMYMLFRKSDKAMEHLSLMERHANASGDEGLKNDVLYNKAIYYYTFGKTAQGNEVFGLMAKKLTSEKEYDKVEQAYKTLIANGKRSNSASLVAQSYDSYMIWKDSVSALKVADEINALKKQIADNEADIADKDSSLSARQAVIAGLGILALILAAALAVVIVVLLRFVYVTRKQKKTIRLANETNALKAKFISNISAQMDPTLQKLDAKNPEVKALKDFSKHIQMLSELENTMDEEVEMTETPIPQFCETLMDSIRDKVKSDVTLKVNAPKMSAKIHQEYVSHILLHLLGNAAEYTPEGGTIWLDYKKRGAHTHQFLVADTGCTIPEEKREDVFKPFLEIKDLATGDGLGLPICKQMALKMKGDLEIDPEFTKGTRFVLDLHS